MGTDATGGGAAKLKLAAVGVALLAVVLFALEFTVLKGDRVGGRGGGEALLLAEGERDSVTFSVERADEPHTLVIDSQPRAVALAYAVYGPDGDQLTAGDDRIRHDDDRWIDFVPPRRGEIRVEIEMQQGPLRRSRAGAERINVDLFVGDRRWLSPLLAAVPFL